MKTSKGESVGVDMDMSLIKWMSYFLKSVDGFFCICICILSLMCFIDLRLNFNFISLRDAADPAKAISLLIASPILILFVVIRLRQLPSPNAFGMKICRAMACFILFYFINF